MRKSKVSPVKNVVNVSVNLVGEHDGVTDGAVDAGSESLSSDSSYSGDSYSDTSDMANWEEYVQEDGTLFYAEYMPMPMSSVKKWNGSGAGEPQSSRRMEFTRSSMRLEKSLARRLKQQQQQQQQRQDHNGINANAVMQQQAQHQSQPQSQPQSQSQLQQPQEFLFSHIGSHESNNLKQLELVITTADRFRFGRRSTPVESILGLSVVPFPDRGDCLMVDGFIQDVIALQPTGQLTIRRGDWLHAINDIKLTTDNVDNVLMQFNEPTRVTLKFYGQTQEAGASIKDRPATTAAAASMGDLKKITNFQMFAEMFEQLSCQTQCAMSNAELQSNQGLIEFALLILPPECYQNDEHRNSLYYYPENVETNFLYKARGSFLTLNTVLTDELKTRPLTSKLVVGETPYFVNYRIFNGFLILFAYPTAMQTMLQCSFRSDEIIRYMRFTLPNLCLSDLTVSSDSAGSAMRLRQFLHRFCEMQRARMRMGSKHGRHACLYEHLLRESKHMPLPKEAQLRIFDALSEMEAMDYRNWNDEPLNTHREFFIHGSALYYDAYLLVSQMPCEMQANVEVFLRCRGIFDLIGQQLVKELYVWEEVQLPNSTGRYFLTICTRSHLTLAVILKIFNAPDLSSDAIIPPSLFYIEEIQETLEHLIQCGIETLAMFWSMANKRPEVIDSIDAPSEAHEKDARKRDSYKQKLTGTLSSSSIAASNSVEEDPHVCSSLGGSSIHSQTPSEEESHKRRLNDADDSDSGSDWENFIEQRQNCPITPITTLNTDGRAHLNGSMWKEISNVVPVKLSTGWHNSIFYYVYVDTKNDTVFCPLKANSESFPFQREMRHACHLIHDVLQLSKRQQHGASPHPNGMLAIKEYGLTIQVPHGGATIAVGAGAGAGTGTGAGADAGASITGKAQFTVVGRLFEMPAREVYICHRPDVAQNIIEMAFRLSFFAMG